ncbi:MAG: peptide-methionine (S)-S-oxide reductase MsrA [Ghiorsea sp.]|nr:peptide-methionine (S)-S-oxide reductase MsrA [Ghiorsea sp.]
MTQNSKKHATFAGGCFWCLVAPFERFEGVTSITSGFAGGDMDNPSYEQVCAGGTGHVEAVQITYDADKVDYQQLLDIFWQNIDPTDAGGSFHDRGFHYTSAIFYHDEVQLEIAQASKQALAESGIFNTPIATVVEPYTNFYPAEEHHQNYHKKNPQHYAQYRIGSGRDAFILQVWNKPKHS